MKTSILKFCVHVQYNIMLYLYCIFLQIYDEIRCITGIEWDYKAVPIDIRVCTVNHLEPKRYNISGVEKVFSFPKSENFIFLKGCAKNKNENNS